MSYNTSSIGVLIFYAYSYYETVSSFNLLSRSSPSPLPLASTLAQPAAPPTAPPPTPSVQPQPKPASVRNPLPFEILAQIAGHLDTRTALAFARVAKDFTEPAEPAIWRDIVLNLPDMWRTRKADELEADLVRCGLPLPDCYSGGYSEGGLISPAMYSSRLHGIAWENRVHLVEHLYWDKIQKLLSAGAAGTRRWKWVESLTLAFHDQPADDLVALLGECSKTIKRLHILEAGSVSLQRGAMEWELFVRSTQLADGYTCLTFTSLTHLTVDRGGIAFIETIPLLISMSPQLVSLVFHAEKQPSSGSPSGLLTRFPYRLVGPTTGLRELDISVDNISYYDSGYDPMETVGDLIEKSPLVEKLRVAIVSVTSGPYGPFGLSVEDMVLLRRLRNHDHLIDLHWSWESRGSWNRGIPPNSSADLATLPSLRRLSVVLQDGKLPSHHSMPSLPYLEKLYAHCEVPLSGGNDRMFYMFNSSGSPTIDPHFASWLRSNPKLRYIHFHLGNFLPIDISRTLDKMERPRVGTTLVHSVRRGDRELFLVRFYVRSIEVERAAEEGTDIENRIVLGDPRSWDSLFRGVAPAAPSTYAISRTPAWHRFTEFEGAAVPLAVVREMRAVEGAGNEDDWGRRGVEVGDKAWKVLTDWRATV